MTTITATYAKNNLGNVWEMSKDEPVVVQSNGVPVAIVLSPKHYEELSNRPLLGRRRNLGVFSEEFKDFDSDAFLDTDVSSAFSEYMP